ncbi:endonuclease/exonuclease/phosphatase family protein [Candidatus Nitrosacidococcus tergens]|uniref:Endonuclease/exonuclease/phosphatase n=1 Tax=Candidatus Nitrosacidococcus tergens TaxID=553981 RepID=A0A7G1Q900_9GAMM|nr:endonuclease/exonuclease/phosphatase family protein [Candidatus Nitrosacidococcus tergens]CAB1275565.1 Endonuclease/exonuclease/phosphatase [Candidatus Nitrosacidococcus tergens]
MSVNPLRFVVGTYNLWNDKYWDSRKDSLRQFIVFHQPDILCLQELCLQGRDLLDQILPSHQRVEDPFEGWVREGNIYWNCTIFDLIAYGAEEIGHLEKWRRLFWVKLQPKCLDISPLLVTTAHYTWSGNKQERKDGINIRIIQSQNTIKVLNRLTTPQDPLLFMGDLNDNFLPLQILREAGLTDCFSALGRIPHVTRPTMPTLFHVPETLDWILHQGNLKPMNCDTVDFFLNNTAPSDHKPVLATYRFLDK